MSKDFGVSKDIYESEVLTAVKYKPNTWGMRKGKNHMLILWK